LDSLTRLQSAERLLRQGKTDGALRELQQLAERASDDLTTLNRIGDLLARHRRTTEAIGYYRKIASRFTTAGHLTKAIAIHKKILRLDAAARESLLELGRLYVRQKHPAEAASYLLRAGEAFLAVQDFAGARQVYEELVAAQPSQPLHRARLAETLAAAGDAPGAAAELRALGDTMLRSGEAAEAEKAFRRASELAPDSAETLAGIARCLREQQQLEPAIALLREGLQREPHPQLLGELLLQCELAERPDEIRELLDRPEAGEIPDAAFEQVVESARDRGRDNQLWERLAPVFDAWVRQGAAERVAGLLERLSGLDGAGYPPALERLAELLRSRGDAAGAAAVLERLGAAYRACGMEAEAERAIERRREIVPAGVHARREAAGSAVAGGTAADTTGEAATSSAEAEAPAVPLSRTDREFATGRLTQAEILEKYGLLDQALHQAREVAERFPGHVEAQRRRAHLLRLLNRTEELQPALVAVALAARASGEQGIAREAVAEALAMGPLGEAARRTLVELGLCAEEPQVAPAPAVETAPPTPGDDEPVVLDAEPDDPDVEIDFGLEPSPPPAAADRVDEEDGAVVLSLDGDDATPLTAADEDLRSISDALEGEPLELRPEGGAAGSGGGEGSIEEVFAEFKRQVSQQVGEQDFRTHYDLGIGYKEMGLVEEAMAEFRLSSQSAELARDSHIMLAVCHREQGNVQEAVRCYREALRSGNEDPHGLMELRYDLADVLAQCGDNEGALDVFREVDRIDPQFRDVRQRIAALER